MLVMPMLRVVFEAIATIRRQRMPGIGIGFTLLGGRSSLEYALYMRVMQKSILPLMSRRRLEPSKERYVYVTVRIYSSAD